MRHFIAYSVASFAFCAAPVVVGGPVASAVEISSTDPQAAEKILGEWFAEFSAAENMMGEFDAKIEAKGESYSPRSEITAYRFIVQRPNKLLLASTRGQGLSVVADDAHVFEYLATKKKYHIKEKPLATFAEVGVLQALKYADYGYGLGLIDAALQATSFDDFRAKFTQVQYMGLDQRPGGGPATHHLLLVRNGVGADVYFTPADNKLQRLIVADMKPILAALAERDGMAVAKPGEPPKDAFPPEVSVMMTVTFKNWRYDVSLPPTAFKAVPPPGAEKVYDIFAAPTHPLLGKQAPGFVTKTLQGQPLSASALAGKVVMLDFWATWCPPCVAALPKVTATADRYRDKGVVFLAVNLGESPADIVPFLAAQNLNAPVVLDSDGSIATRYAVSAIPQTVIIDAKGMVQVVHIGAGSDIGDQLAQELDDILAGKDLLADKLKPKP